MPNLVLALKAIIFRIIFLEKVVSNFLLDPFGKDIPKSLSITMLE